MLSPQDIKLRNDTITEMLLAKIKANYDAGFIVSTHVYADRLSNHLKRMI